MQGEQRHRGVELGPDGRGGRHPDDPRATLGVGDEGDVAAVARQAAGGPHGDRVEAGDRRARQGSQVGGRARHAPTVCRGVASDGAPHRPGDPGPARVGCRTCPAPSPSASSPCAAAPSTAPPTGGPSPTSSRSCSPTRPPGWPSSSARAWTSTGRTVTTVRPSSCCARPPRTTDTAWRSSWARSPASAGDPGSPTAYLAVVGDPTEAGHESWATLRGVGETLTDRDAGIFTTTQALANWHAAHPFCPRCGSPTVAAQAGWVRRCERDGSEHYPRTDPAVIMAVVDDDDRLLLGRGAPVAARTVLRAGRLRRARRVLRGRGGPRGRGGGRRPRHRRDLPGQPAVAVPLVAT